MKEIDFRDILEKHCGKNYSNELIEMVLRENNSSFKTGKEQGKKEVYLKIADRIGISELLHIIGDIEQDEELIKEIEGFKQ